MDIYAYKNNSKLDKIRVFSIGGGSILIAGEKGINPPPVYEHNSFCKIADYCKKEESDFGNMCTKEKRALKHF